MKRIIANWKLEKSHYESLSWFKDNHVELKKLSKHADIIICPTSISLEALKPLGTQAGIDIAAQNCAAYESGPYVGHVSARSLQEINCNYCLVNHSQQTDYDAENSLHAALKAKILLHYKIEPIICVGETAQQAAGDIRFRILERQLASFKPVLQEANYKQITLVYEPIWAIGTNSNDPAFDANIVFEWLQEYAFHNFPQTTVHYLYGGGVTQENVQFYKQIEHLDGLFLGKQSLDFQTFKKIVELGIEEA